MGGQLEEPRREPGAAEETRRVGTEAEADSRSKKKKKKRAKEKRRREESSKKPKVGGKTLAKKELKELYSGTVLDPDPRVRRVGKEILEDRSKV